MEIQAIVDRFEHYAIHLKEIQHIPDDFANRAFFHFDFEDIQAAIREGCKFPLLLLLTPETSKDGNPDSVTEGWDGSYMILDHVKTTKTACISNCKKISDKIFNRMLADAPEFFDGNLVQTNEGMTGPTTDKLYGWLVPFGFTQAYNAELNANDWEDLT